MTSSGLYSFAPSAADLIIDAFERVRVRPAALTSEQMISATRSMNLLLQEWSNKGPNLWTITEAALGVVTGTKLYALPANCVLLLDMWWAVDAGYGNGTTDRILIPITRDQYAEIPNKDQQGSPTQYWFERTIAPQVTLYQVPSQDTTSSPASDIRFKYMRPVQDASPANGQTLDIPNYFLEAFTADLAWRLGGKFADMAIWAAIKDDIRMAKEQAWALARDADTELAPITIVPNLSNYWRK